MTSKRENFADLSQLSNDYSRLCFQPEHSDVILVVSGEKIPAHKLILAARSRYFERKLNEPHIRGEIVFEASNTDAFKILLKYIYTGCVSFGQIEIPTILSIFGLAREYSLTSLEKASREALTSSFETESVAILNYARANQIQDLISDCEIFQDVNAVKILADRSFLSLSEESLVGILKRNSFCAPELEIFKAVLKWSQQNSFEKAKEVVKYVRLSLIEPLEITKIVAPTGIFDYDALFSGLEDSLSGQNIFNMARGSSVFNRDLASSEMGAKFLTGVFYPEDSYRYIEIAYPDEPSPVGIMLELKEVTMINNICMLLWDTDEEARYSYYIEVSTDQTSWIKVIDFTPYTCRSLQDLYFEKRAVKYINIVGTFAFRTHNEVRLVYLKAHCKVTIPRTYGNFVYPSHNVASLETKAIVVCGGANDVCLDGNYTNYNSSEGFTTGSKIWIRLAQPYMISYIKFLLLDCDDRSYNFKVETYLGLDDPQVITDKTEGEHRSWQTFYFKEHPVDLIRVNSTKTGERLRIVHFECMHKPVEESDNPKRQEEVSALSVLKLAE